MYEFIFSTWFLFIIINLSLVKTDQSYHPCITYEEVLILSPKWNIVVWSKKAMGYVVVVCNIVRVIVKYIERYDGRHLKHTPERRRYFTSGATTFRSTDDGFLTVSNVCIVRHFIHNVWLLSESLDVCCSLPSREWAMVIVQWTTGQRSANFRLLLFCFTPAIA